MKQSKINKFKGIIKTGKTFFGDAKTAKEEIRNVTIEHFENKKRRETMGKIDYRVTNIQLFDYVEKRQIDELGNCETIVSYSANIAINDKFLVQVCGDQNSCTFDGICDPDITAWNSYKDQENAYNNLKSCDIEATIYADGFENNWPFLCDNGEIMDTENNIEAAEVWSKGL